MGDVVSLRGKLDTFQDVIDRWPSMLSLALDLDVEYDTVRKWRERDRIPQEHFAGIVYHGKRLRLGIRADDLVRIASGE